MKNLMKVTLTLLAALCLLSACMVHPYDHHRDRRDGGGKGQYQNR